MEKIIESLLRELGEDPQRHGLEETPARVKKALQYLTQGYRQDPRAVLEKAVFEEKYDEMVIVKDIDIFSLCEHHLLPFYGRCHIAYIPDGRIVGLSKLARIANVFSRRLQVQERLTCQIADTIMEVLQPKGAACVIEALHLCMAMRGVEKQRSTAITSSLLGVFRSDSKARGEFLHLVGMSH